MPSYHFHPDVIVYLRDGGNVYVDTPENFLLDAGVPAVVPGEGFNEIYYDPAGLKENRHNLDAVNVLIPDPVPEIDAILDNMLTTIDNKTARLAAEAVAEQEALAAAQAAIDAAMTYQDKRRIDILAQWPVHAQLEALTEAAAGNPAKQSQLLADIAVIKLLYPVA